MSALQNIFTIKLPKASERPGPEYLDLPDTAGFLQMKFQENSVDGKSSTLESYNELISDILTEVIMNMAKGNCPILADNIAYYRSTE